MGIFSTEKTEYKSKTNVPLSGIEAKVYKVLDLYPQNLDTLSNMASLPVPDLLTVLLQLQLKGLSEEVGKNNYLRKV